MRTYGLVAPKGFDKLEFARKVLFQASIGFIHNFFDKASRFYGLVIKMEAVNRLEGSTSRHVRCEKESKNLEKSF